MKLRGNRISLRPYQAEDKEKMSSWFREDGYDAFFAIFKERDLYPANSDDFEKEFSVFGIKLWMVVAKNPTKLPSPPTRGRGSGRGGGDVFGCVAYFPLVKKAEVFQMTLLVDQKNQHQKMAFESFVLAAHELFSRHGCRKLVCLSPATNSYFSQIKQRAGLICEAVLKRHDFVGGQYVDLERAAIFREDFFKQYQDVLAAFGS